MDWGKKDNKPGQNYRSKRTGFTVNHGAYSDREWQGCLVMGKTYNLWKRHPLRETEYRATNSDLSL